MVENMPDDKVLEILNQAAKSSRETISKLGDGELRDFAKIELEIIESYLPEQMLESEIREKIESLIADGASNVAEIMRAFATLPADRKRVAQIYQYLK